MAEKYFDLRLYEQLSRIKMKEISTIFDSEKNFKPLKYKHVI